MNRNPGDAYNRVVTDFGGLLIFCEVEGGALKIAWLKTQLQP